MPGLKFEDVPELTWTEMVNDGRFLIREFMTHKQRGRLRAQLSWPAFSNTIIYSDIILNLHFLSFPFFKYGVLNIDFLMVLL